MKGTKAIPRMAIVILLATLGGSCIAGEESATKKAEKPLSLKIVGEFLISLTDPHLTTLMRNKLEKEEFSQNIGRVYEGEIEVWDVREVGENVIVVYNVKEHPIEMLFKFDATVDRKRVESLNKRDRINIRAKLCKFYTRPASYINTPEIQVAIFDNASILQVVSPLPRRTTLQGSSIRFDLIRDLIQGLSTSFERKFTVTSVCFSLDGRILFSGTAGSVELWDTRTWKLNRMMKAKYVTKVVCSPDNKSLVAAVEGKGGPDVGKLIIYDTRTWKIKHILTGPTHKLGSVAFSPLGKLIAGSCGTITQTRPKHRLKAQGLVIVWDMYEEKVLWRKEFGAIPVNSIAFSPDGQFLVTGDDEDVKVWAATTWDQVAILKRQRIPGLEVRDWVQSVVFSPNGKVLASGNSDGTLVLWDTKTWKEKLTLRGHERDHRVTSLAFSPNGKLLASGSLDKTVNLWHAERGTLEAKIKHNNYVTTVAFSPDGKILASGGYFDDNKIKLWNLVER